MVRGIRLSKWVGEDGEEQEAELTRFVRAVKRKIQYGEDNWIEDTVDPRLKGKFSRQQAAMMVKIATSLALHQFGIAQVHGPRDPFPWETRGTQLMVTRGTCYQPDHHHPDSPKDMHGAAILSGTPQGKANDVSASPIQGRANDAGRA
ncbi:hypothetical protein CK203_018630 [Vitis vinifera]|uniref:Uncharacterized protein n=1 Tax=Vitis vinifera TaxID=29760 RepID=A0A438JAW8_VITVI|nr:hypothetical protein CK203_018630 [Vitis vinifera]